jgi:hypothetical protein
MSLVAQALICFYDSCRIGMAELDDQDSKIEHCPPASMVSHDSSMREEASSATRNFESESAPPLIERLDDACTAHLSIRMSQVAKKKMLRNAWKQSTRSDIDMVSGIRTTVNRSIETAGLS